MKRVLNIIVLMVLVIYAQASENQMQLMDSAAQYYSDAKFEKAIESYEQVLTNGFESGELYYNLGNAYFKSNKMAQAIVNYERAKKLLPNDEDVDFNLKLANTYVIDKIDAIPDFFLSSWWNRFIQLFGSNHWAYVSLAFFFVGFLLVLIFFLSQQVLVRKASFWLGLLLIIVSVFAFSFSHKQKWLAENEPQAIVLTPSVVVKSAPSENGTELFLIHEGLKIKVTDQLNDWREIRLPDGNKGWIKKTDVVVI